MYTEYNYKLCDMRDLIFSRFKRKAKHWWVGLIIGLIVMALGFWSLTVPQETLIALNIVFIISFIVGGLLDISYALATQKDKHDWGWLLFNGLISFILGLMLATQPLTSIFVLLLYVGIWMLFQSVSVIMSSIRMKNSSLSGWQWLMVLGILGFIFGIVLIMKPAITTVFIVTLFSYTLVLYGFIRVFYAFKMLDLHREIKKM